VHGARKQHSLCAAVLHKPKCFQKSLKLYKWDIPVTSVTLVIVRLRVRLPAGHRCAATLGKLFTIHSLHLCLCHKTVAL